MRTKAFPWERETSIWQTCILFCHHLASLAEGDLPSSFPYNRCGLLIACTTKDLLLSTKYENILWFSECINQNVMDL